MRVHKEVVNPPPEKKQQRGGETPPTYEQETAGQGQRSLSAPLGQICQPGGGGVERTDSQRKKGRRATTLPRRSTPGPGKTTGDAHATHR